MLFIDLVDLISVLFFGVFSYYVYIGIGFVIWIVVFVVIFVCKGSLLYVWVG